MKGYRTVYSVYRGADLIAEGTQREIMEKTGMNASSLWAKDRRGELKRVWCERRYEERKKAPEWYERHREAHLKYYRKHREEILKNKNGKR